MVRNPGRLGVAGTLLLLALLGSERSAVRAQGLATRTSADYGVSPNLTFSTGGTAYLPYSGGGFVPYSGGPGGASGWALPGRMVSVPAWGS